jgi:hypothetical protein
LTRNTTFDYLTTRQHGLISLNQQCRAVLVSKHHTCSDCFDLLHGKVIKHPQVLNLSFDLYKKHLILTIKAVAAPLTNVTDVSL